MQVSHALDALLHNWFYGNYGVRVAAAVIFAFLLGSIPLGPIVEWLFCDLNPRARRAAATCVPVLNALQGFIATAIVFHGGGQLIGIGAALAAMLGHYFSPWRRFRGGQRVDFVVGILLAFSPPSAAVIAAFWLVSELASGSEATGTAFASALIFLPLWFFAGATAAFFGITAGTMILLRLWLQGQRLERV